MTQLKGQAFFALDSNQNEFFAFLCAGGQYVCSKISHTKKIDQASKRAIAKTESEVDQFFGKAAKDKRSLF